MAFIRGNQEEHGKAPEKHSDRSARRRAEREQAGKPQLVVVGLEGKPYDVEHLRELIKSDMERRKLEVMDRLHMRILPASAADTKIHLRGRPAYSLGYYAPDGLGIDYSRDPNFTNSDGEAVRWRFLDGGTPKYYQRAGSELHAYFPHLPDGSPPWPQIAKDPSYPLGLTEGEITAYVLCKFGFTTIGLGGVNSYGSKRLYQRILEELVCIEWRGREVSIPYDSDMMGKPQVAHAAGDLALRLSELGARPKLVKIPNDYATGEKLGADDYLVKYGAEPYRNLPRAPFAMIEKLFEFRSKWALIRKPFGYYNFEDRDIYSVQDFKDITATEKIITEDAKGKRIERAAGSAYHEWSNRLEFRGVAYEPGGHETTSDGKLNRWLGWGCNAVYGDVSPFLDLMAHLLPDSELRRYIIQIIAYPFAHPGAKVTPTLVITGIPGAGKSLLAELLMRAYGASNVSKIGNRQLDSTFNGFIGGKQLIVAEEIRGTGSIKRDYDVLKDWLTSPTVRVNDKHVKELELPNKANWLFLSNHLAPLHIETKDRRFVVIRVETPIGSEKGSAVARWGRESGGCEALRHYLTYEVDLADFDPQAGAWSTEAKLAVIDAGRSATERWAHDLMSDEDRPAVATTAELRINAKDTTGAEPNDTAMRAALFAAGAVCLKTRINLTKDRTSKATVWSLRGPLTLEFKGEHEDLREILTKQYSERARFFAVPAGKLPKF